MPRQTCSSHPRFSPELRRNPSWSTLSATTELHNSRPKPFVLLSRSQLNSDEHKRELPDSVMIKVRVYTKRSDRETTLQSARLTVRTTVAQNEFLIREWTKATSNRSMSHHGRVVCASEICPSCTVVPTPTRAAPCQVHEAQAIGVYMQVHQKECIAYHIFFVK